MLRPPAFEIIPLKVSLNRNSFTSDPPPPQKQNTDFERNHTKYIQLCRYQITPHKTILTYESYTQCIFSQQSKIHDFVYMYTNISK